MAGKREAYAFVSSSKTYPKVELPSWMLNDEEEEE